MNYVCMNVSGVIGLRSCNPCNEFRCESGQCVLRSWRCDGGKDCKDGTDEVGCPSCSSYQYRCQNGRCINKNHVCDKVNNCGDGSDEFNCNKKSGTGCVYSRYRCGNDKCIPGKWVCDNQNDCGDNSDEKGCTPNVNKRDEIIDPSKEEDEEKEKGKVKEKDAASNSLP